jgi:hypothetical protein
MQSTTLRGAWVLAVGALMTAGIAHGAVLCQRKSGAVVVRETCKKKETPLDLAAFGAVGPQGPKGDAGEPGAPGLARIFATIDASGVVVSKGGALDVSVEKTGTGAYCVLVPAAIGATNGTAVATLEQPGGTDIVSIGSLHGSSCNGFNTDTTGAFPVYVRTTAGAAIDRGFNLVVP